MAILSLKMIKDHLRVFPKCELICPHNLKLASENTPQYLCQSYYDDDGILQDCTCRKCK